MEHINETFKPIQNFQKYLISNLGNVKNIKTNRILKIQKSQGYSTVSLNNCNKQHTCLVHRLVAQEFIPNLENKLTVNHKNHDTHDNRVENLEWLTQKEQNIYNYTTQNNKRHTNRARSVICIDKNENKIEFRTLSEGSEWLLKNSSSKNIESCLSGIRNSLNNGIICQGYIWKYNDLDEIIIDGEFWKEIPDELTLGKSNYFISNNGRFKNNRGKIVDLKNHSQYISISFRNKTQKVTHQLHRIVAKLFVENVENKLFVNHIDGNKNNNSADNLEWVTKSENTKHAHSKGLISKNFRKIAQFDKNENFIAQYESIKEASIILGLDKSSIGHVCAKDRPGSNTCGGFIFKYVKNDDNMD
jgi:hypothetical protein